MTLFVICPHCQGHIEIVQINCAIFRHGVYKRTGQQLPPHAPKSECDTAAQQGLIEGCGKPFRVIRKENPAEYEAVVCDYI